MPVRRRPAVRRTAAAALLAATALLPGCVLLAGAAIGAGIVHVTGEDEAVVSLESARAEAFRASREVLEAKGVVEVADASAGKVEGRIGSSSVEIRIDPGVDGGSRVTVESRSNSGISPDPETAQQTASAIVARCR